MKSLAISVVLLLSSVTHPDKKDQSSDLPRNNAPEKAAPSFYANNQTTCPKTGDGDNKSQPGWKNPEWWLFAAAVPTLIFVGWQAKATAETAEASLKSANAALLNAQAVMHAERAWMIVSQIDGKRATTTSDGLALFMVNVDFKNMGKSPAFLLDGETKWRVLAEGVPLPETPDINKDEGVADILQLNGIPIQPNGEYHIRNIDGGIQIPDIGRLLRGQDILWVYGFMRFRDAFGRFQEIWYCYKWESNSGTVYQPSWIAGGPTAYNQTTYQYDNQLNQP